jgi:hypothetical protein
MVKIINIINDCIWMRPRKKERFSCQNMYVVACVRNRLQTLVRQKTSGFGGLWLLRGLQTVSKES